MDANIYLCNSTFQTTLSSEADLDRRVCQLAEDFEYIKNNGDKLFKNESIWNVEIIQGFFAQNVYDLENATISRDTKVLLRKIIEYSKSTDMSDESIIESLYNNNSEILNGILCLNQFNGEIDIDLRPCVIYDKNDWLSFHRYFLSLYPLNSKYFYEECNKYFPSTFIHPRIKETLNGMSDPFTNFSRNIVYCLTHLNDNFKSYYDSSNVQNSVQRFASSIKFEVSLEGNAARKRNLTFTTLDNRSQNVEICCDPHIKLSESDIHPADSEYYFYRIYFHGGKSNIANGKVFIGHIGNHL